MDLRGGEENFGGMLPRLVRHCWLTCRPGSPRASQPWTGLRRWFIACRSWGFGRGRWCVFFGREIRVSCGWEGVSWAFAWTTTCESSWKHCRDITGILTGIATGGDRIHPRRWNRLQRLRRQLPRILRPARPENRRRADLPTRCRREAAACLSLHGCSVFAI